MAQLRQILLLLFVLEVSCFITDDKVSSTTTGQDSTSALLTLILDERNMRHQLQQTVTDIKHELDQLKHGGPINISGTPNEFISLKEAVNNLTKENERLMKENSQMSKDLNTVSQTCNQLSGTVLKLENSYTDIINSIHALNASGSGEERIPKFSAISIYRYTDYQYGEVLHFNYADVNIADVTDHKFHCPVTGTYLISATVDTRKGGRFAIYHNDQKEYTIFASNDDGFESGSATVLLQLQSGDTVCVKSLGSYSVYYPYCYFSGFLVPQ